MGACFVSAMLLCLECLTVLGIALIAEITFNKMGNVRAY